MLHICTVLISTSLPPVPAGVTCSQTHGISLVLPMLSCSCIYGSLWSTYMTTPQQCDFVTTCDIPSFHWPSHLTFFTQSITKCSRNIFSLLLPLTPFVVTAEDNNYKWLSIKYYACMRWIWGGTCHCALFILVWTGQLSASWQTWSYYINTELWLLR